MLHRHIYPVQQPHAAGAPPKAATPYSNGAAPRSGNSPQSSFLLSVIQQPRAARAPPKAASSLLLLSSSPAQRELPPKQPLHFSYPAAPRSGSSPQSSLCISPIEQPRAAGAPPEAASAFLQSSSPAQRELPPKQPLHFSYPAAPRSGSSPKSSLFLTPSEQPRAAGAPPKAASSCL